MAYKQLLYPYKWNSIASPIKYRFAPEIDDFQSVNNVSGRAQFVLGTINQDFQEGRDMLVMDTSNYDGTHRIVKLEYDGTNYLVLTSSTFQISETGRISSYSAPLIIIYNNDGNKVAEFKPDFRTDAGYFEFEIQGYLSSMFKPTAQVPASNAALQGVLWDSAYFYFYYEFGKINQFQSLQTFATVYFVNAAITTENLNRYFVGIRQLNTRPPLTPLNSKWTCGTTLRVSLNNTQDALTLDNSVVGVFNYSKDKEGQIW